MKVSKTYHPRFDQIAMILLEDFEQNNTMFSQKCFKIYHVLLSIHPTIVSILMQIATMLHADAVYCEYEYSVCFCIV